MPLDALVTGRIATFAGDAGFGWVEAIGIRDRKVAFAGSAVDLESRADPHTRRIDLEPGEIAIPGLIDAHLHVADAALAADQVNLTTAQTVEEAAARVAEAAARQPEPAWIEGGGWDQRRFGAWPTAAALDRAAPGRKVVLRSFDHHAMWASSAALQAAGIDRSTADPDGGVIRRSEDGAPEGVLLENASALIEGAAPAWDQATLGEAIVRLGRELLALGVVGAHDPRHLAPDPSNRLYDTYIALAAAGELPIRVHVGVRSEGLEDTITRGFRSAQDLDPSGSGRLVMGWLKLFADGTLASKTAALLEPVEGTDNRGMFTTPPDQMRDFANRAADAGIATKIHSIGDAAVRTSLDILGPTASKVPFMPRLEHVQLCDPVDRARFAELGVGASVQPVHLREDAASAGRDWGARAERGGYTWKSLLDAGATLGFGTDAPVEPIDPWPGIAIAVLRRDPSWGEEAVPFGADEGLTLEQSLRAATVGPAQFAREKLGGRLVPGSRADLIVLPAAPREGPERAAAFAEVRPRLVMVDGETVVEH